MFIYTSVTFIATMFMVNKDYQKEIRKNISSAVTIWSLRIQRIGGSERYMSTNLSEAA